MRCRAFTIIELLVVIVIIGALTGLLFAALRGSHATSRAMVSQSNLRQWGLANFAFCAANNDELPWEGYKGAAEMHLNFVEPSWWANALPPYVNQPPYSQLSLELAAAGRKVPLPGDDTDSIFIDPSADVPPVAPHIGGLPDQPLQFFFCYVPNLQLNATLESESLNINAHPRMRLATISNASATILMLEMRTVQSELKADDPYYNFTLVRARSDWKRLANRHREGGHVLLADGHVQQVNFKWATTNNLGTRNPDEPGADWNKPNLIWNPRGPAVEGPGS